MARVSAPDGSPLHADGRASPASRSPSRSGGSTSAGCRCSCSTRSCRRTTPSQRWTTARLYEGNRAVRLAQYGLLGIGGRAGAASARDRARRHPSQRGPSGARAARARRAARRARRLDRGRAASRARAARSSRRTRRCRRATRRTRRPSSSTPSAISPTGSGIDDEEFLGLCRVNPGDDDEPPGMTPLAIRMSRRRNGVSRLHGEVARAMWQPMFPGCRRANVPITHVTNGATSRPSSATRCASCSQPARSGVARARSADPAVWEGGARHPERGAVGGPLRGPGASSSASSASEPGRTACSAASRSTTCARSRPGSTPDALTIGFARRFATYKRVHLLTHDPDRALPHPHGRAPVQLLVAGKAHPSDEAGKDSLQRLYNFKRDRAAIADRVVILEDYDLDVARAPRLRLRRLDQPAAAADGGERHERHEGDVQRRAPAERARRLVGRGATTARTAGRSPATSDSDPSVVDDRDAARLYDLLENEVIPLFYDRDDARRAARLVRADQARARRRARRPSAPPAWSTTTSRGSTRAADRGLRPSRRCTR